MTKPTTKPPIATVAIGAGWGTAIRAATPEAAELLLAELVQKSLTAALEIMRPGIDAALMAAGDRVWARAYELGLAEGRRSGFQAGKRSLTIGPEAAAALGKALAAALPAQAAPVVNVSPTPVTVENTVNVPPQRTVRATPQRDGSVILEPQP
jgi:hypothetical protein